LSDPSTFDPLTLKITFINQPELAEKLEENELMADGVRQAINDYSEGKMSAVDLNAYFSHFGAVPDIVSHVLSEAVENGHQIPGNADCTQDTFSLFAMGQKANKIAGWLSIVWISHLTQSPIPIILGIILNLAKLRDLKGYNRLTDQYGHWFGGFGDVVAQKLWGSPQPAFVATKNPVTFNTDNLLQGDQWFGGTASKLPKNIRYLPPNAQPHNEAIHTIKEPPKDGNK